MTEEMDVITTEERYARAIGSSHLDVKERVQGDADILIAAALSQRVFGTTLFRLRQEWDLVRGDLDRARNRYVPEAAAVAELHEEAARHQEQALIVRVPRRGKVLQPGPTQAALFQERAAALRLQAQRDRRDAILQARAFALLQLKTLQQAVDSMGRWSVVQATKQAFMVSDAEVLALAGRVLEAWIDPMCDSCNGSGKRRAGAAREVQCRACSGTGRRNTSIGQSVSERLFARYLLAQMDGMAAEAERRMRALLSAR